MTDNDQRRLFDDLSWVFAIINDPKDYADEAAEYTRIILGTTAARPRTLLDLGCGAGRDDFNLKKDFEVTGVDMSESMVSLAKKLNPEARYVVGDIRHLRLDAKYDAVLMTDSVTSMTTVKDLKAAFTTAFVHLKPGGVFCVLAKECLDNFVQNRTFSFTRASEDVEITMVENHYDVYRNDTAYEKTLVYLIRRRGKLEVEVDRHFCGLFKLDDWEFALHSIGFDVKRTIFGRDVPLFVCRKPETADAKH
jgi:ubiquinone/menaquinone biosynthesis C-methylase UbiE